MDFYSLMGGAAIAIVSGWVGFQSNFKLQETQFKEKQKDQIKNRRIETAKAAISSVCDLLSVITQFSDLNIEISKASEGKHTFFSLLQEPGMWDSVRKENPENIELIYRYHKAIAEVWKANGYVRMDYGEELSNDMKDYTNDLNSFIQQDIHIGWEDLMEKGNRLIDKLGDNIEILKKA
jgi:hypothetical protein